MTRSFFIPISGFWLLSSGFSLAILDTNNNCLSDLWEKEHNAGELFPANFDPQADYDADGWSNDREAAAGTDPHDPNPPDGIIRPATEHVPAVIGEQNGVPYVISSESIKVTWPTLTGKQYTLLYSPDLTQGSWLPVGDPVIANGGLSVYVFYEVNATDKCFWRVAVNDIDTDGDGLTDHEEHLASTDSNHADTDFDGMDDRWEMIHGLDPADWYDAYGDPDGDGIFNRYEYALDFHPTIANAAELTADQDNDDMPDYWEAETGFFKWSPQNQRYEFVRKLDWENPADATQDADADGLTNLVEYQNNTNPLDPDTDDDFMPDGWEVLNNGKTIIHTTGPAAAPSSSAASSPETVSLNPRDASDAALDPDHDGLTNLQEYLNGTAPERDDTDNDGTSDGEEVNTGADPNNGSDGGTPGGQGSGTVVVEVPFAIGGDYAWWEMTIQGQGPKDARILKITSNKDAESGLGDYEGEIQMIKLHEGNKYRMTMKRMGGVEEEDGAKWYCWSANVGMNQDTDKLVPEVRTFDNYPDSKDDRLENQAIAYAVSGENADSKKATWLVDNKEGLFTRHIDDYNKNVAQTLEAFLLPVEVVPDYNRDGMINDDDRGKVSEEKPFVFWTNDDDDANAEPHVGDIPGTQVDGADMLVNDARDLVDFFPVQLRIKEILAVLPADKYTYKVSHPTGAFHFIEMPGVHTDSSPEAQGAGAYLRNPTMADEAMARPMSDTAGQGAELTAEYLNAAKDGMGVLLFEAKSATNQSFELIITKKSSGAEVARILRALPVEIAENPENMYWRANIRPAAYGQAPSNVYEPTSAWFKASRKERWFVFCHGYNVSEEAARGWNSEMFKRLYQLGSDAKFLGVTWEGNQGRLGANTIIPFEGGFAPDYWRNVYNAFSSSQALATLVNGLSGGGRVVAGHSLGNMIMGSAICDKGLNAENYFMLNAAVPREAYFPDHIATDRNSVRNPTFQPYPTRLWSSDWKNLFPNSDGRSKLTWQGRFGELATKTTPHNYYSTGEEVVKSGNGNVPGALDLALGNSAWIIQEMSKGNITKAFVTGAGTGNWSANGGWEFNPNHYQQYRPNPLDPPGGTLPDTAAITNAQLMVHPFFKPFTMLTIQNGGAVPDSANGVDLASSQGSAHAANYAVKAWLLAHDVPAISQPAASNPINGIDGKDMNGEYKTGNWGNWKHSDLKEQPLDGVWKLFKDMVTRGDLKK